MGISVKTDSMEGDLIHCIKPGGVVADTAAAILAETATLIAGNEDNLDKLDPFASDEDFEDDETVIDVTS